MNQEMRRLAALAISWLLIAGAASSCTPPPPQDPQLARLTLQIYNRTDRPVRATVFFMSRVELPTDKPEVDLVVEPGAMTETALPFPGSAAVVRAYADGRLIFCRLYNYNFTGEGTGLPGDAISTGLPGDAIGYVHIVGGKITPECRDIDSSK
jgi:hypothetical protein